MNPVIVLPSEYANEKLSSYVLERRNWSLFNLTEFELTHLIRFEPQKSQCFWRKIEGIEGMEEITELTSYPNIEKPYVKPKLKCQRVKISKFVANNESVYKNGANSIMIIIWVCSYTMILLLVITKHL